MKKQTLAAWVVRWCERPGMYLVGPSDKGEPDISNLWLLMAAYTIGAGHLDSTPPSARRRDASDEWNKLEDWIVRNRPQYSQETWSGNSILKEAGGNHWKAAEEFKRLAEEFLRSRE
jgi:hypothetical protein